MNLWSFSYYDFLIFYNILSITAEITGFFLRTGMWVFFFFYVQKNANNETTGLSFLPSFIFLFWSLFSLSLINGCYCHVLFKICSVIWFFRRSPQLIDEGFLFFLFLKIKNKNECHCTEWLKIGLYSWLF